MSPQTQQVELSEWDRLSGVFFSPRAAFTDIAARPRPWVPLILAVLMSITFTALFSQRVGWERFMRQTMDRTPRMQQLSAEQRERALELQMKIAPVMGYVGAVAATPVMALAIAAVLLLVFRVFQGAEVTYRQLFGITSYSFLVFMVSSATAILVMFLKNPDDFNLQNPTAFNLAAFLDPDAAPRWLQSLGGSVDLFSFWIIFLLATGVSAAVRKFPLGRALAGVIAPWLVWVGVKTAWTVLVG